MNMCNELNQVDSFVKQVSHIFVSLYFVTEYSLFVIYLIKPILKSEY